jgi:hypothetical protein
LSIFVLVTLIPVRARHRHAGGWNVVGGHTDAAQPSAPRPPISELVQPFEQRSLALVPLGDPQPQRFHFQVLHVAGVRAVFPSPIAPVLRIPERSAALFDAQRPVGHGMLSVLRFGC